MAGFLDGIFKQSDDQAENGFLSTLGTTFSRFVETAGETAGELLPVWAGQQLNLQRNDQLSQPTFVPAQGATPTQPSTTTTENALNRPVSTLGGGVTLSQNMLLLIGGGVLLVGVMLQSND